MEVLEICCTCKAQGGTWCMNPTMEEKELGFSQGMRASTITEHAINSQCHDIYQEGFRYPNNHPNMQNKE